MNMTKQEALEKIKALELQANGFQAEIDDLKQAIANIPEDDVPETLDFADGETAIYVETDLTVDTLAYSQEFDSENKKHLLFKSPHMARIFASRVQFIANMLFLSGFMTATMCQIGETRCSTSGKSFLIRKE